MLSQLNGLSDSELVRWAEASIKDNAHVHGRGYQGNVYLFNDKGYRLIVKAASGAGPLKWLRRRMLRNESEVYRKLVGFPGSPRCHGLLQGRYLVLECIDGVPIRHAEISDREKFFGLLLEYIKELHRRGVAHGDLKRKDNLMVIAGNTPRLIDFGAAIVRKPGFAPLNHYLYNLARKFDYNAWVKLKYSGNYENISPADLVYFDRTRVEKAARWIKGFYTKIKRRLFD